jgi:branched-chain amino acid transport system substrate-binding protein
VAMSGKPLDVEVQTVCLHSDTPGAGALVSGPAAAEDLKVGVIQPLSGPVAASGGYVVNGAKIAADEVNEKGGVLGGKLVLLVEDNKSDPAEAVNAAEKLIQRDRVPVLMGAWGSSMTLAVMPKLQQYEVPMVVETSSSGKITKQGNRFVFRISPTSEMEAIGIGDHLTRSLHMKKVAMLAVNTDWGRGAAQVFGDALKRQGAEVVATEFMDQKDTDLSAQLTKIKSANPDSVLLTTDVGQIALVLKQAAGLGMRPTWLTTGGSSAPAKLIDLAGPAAEGTHHILFFLPWFPEAMPAADKAKWFVDEWKRRGFPFEGLTEGFRGYDGVMTIAAAARKAGKADAKAITEALRGVELMGLNGPIKFNAEGQSQPGIYVVQVKGGKVVLPAFMQKKS